jgi:hypothetical protein
VSLCGKVKAHLVRKQEGLEPRWFTGAGKRPRSGVLLKPRLDMEKIPWRAWAMLLGPEAPMKAPKAVWQALFDIAERNPAPLLGVGASTLLACGTARRWLKPSGCWQRRGWRKSTAMEISLQVLSPSTMSLRLGPRKASQNRRPVRTEGLS